MSKNKYGKMERYMKLMSVVKEIFTLDQLIFLYNCMDNKLSEFVR